MKDFKDWGIRIRKAEGYYALWYNLKTYRLETGYETKPLEPNKSEFYDISITSKCNAFCPWCYVNASEKGEDATNIVETWNRFIASNYKDDKDASQDKTILELLGKPELGEGFEELKLRLLVQLVKHKGLPIIETELPFQGAVGSTGEPTVHPDLPKFLQAMFESRIVPNYTTNGIILSDPSKKQAAEIMEATRNFCGGVAVSYGNKKIRHFADKAIENLLKYGECKVVVHHIISDNASVDDFLALQKSMGQDIHYHVLLPLMAHGRSTEKMETETYLYLTEKVKEYDIRNIAFGANFAPFMKNNPGMVDVWEYPQEIYSKNLILKPEGIVITPSSFNLTPICTL